MSAPTMPAATPSTDAAVVAAAAGAIGALTPQLEGELALLALAGSRAYGTERAGSDVDLRGVTVGPAVALLDGRGVRDRYELTVPDTVVYELGKLVALSAAGNPNALEVLYSPQMLHVSPAGQVLLDGREVLLSRRAHAAYAGYAASQLKRLSGERGPVDPAKRRKHQLHTFRLLDAGTRLLTTGTLQVTVDDLAELDALAGLDADTAAAEAQRRLERLDAAVAVSPLPETPSRDLVADLTLAVRAAAEDAVTVFRARLGAEGAKAAR